MNSARPDPLPIYVALMVGNVDTPDRILAERGFVRDPNSEEAKPATNQGRRQEIDQPKNQSSDHVAKASYHRWRPASKSGRAPSFPKAPFISMAISRILSG
jgi:hypothetical protein